MSASATTGSVNMVVEGIFANKKLTASIQNPLHGKVGWRQTGGQGLQEVIWFSSGFDHTKDGWKTVDDFRTLSAEEAKLRRGVYSNTFPGFAKRGWQRSYRLLRSAVLSRFGQPASSHQHTVPASATPPGLAA